MTDATPAIRCLAVSKQYGAVDALRDFTLEAPTHGVLGLLGPSGSGKTTALRVIAGFERPDSGIVEIAGRTVVDDRLMTPPERRRVGMVFQHYALFPHLDVAGNVGYGLDGSEDERTRIAEVLEMVGLSGAERRMPHELSGGEQQRVALARALAPRPDVVLLDEPFSNLDARRRDAVRREVRTILVEARATAVFVTHDQEEALAMSDIVAVMRDGTVLQVADPAELYHRPTDCWVARFLGEAEFVDGTAHDGRVETPFGAFPIDAPLRGDVEVMIRPESVRVAPADPGSALVVDREFYGHDQLITLSLDDGRRLLSRMGPGPVLRPGDRVDVEIDHVVAFPAEHGEG
ncbi:MAG: ABC transporter ATP-binding protein [Acidimicrobiia bacterium]|nr:ABC transporter ATP-binding protein [Acidimicrobiia bacterium]